MLASDGRYAVISKPLMAHQLQQQLSGWTLPGNWPARLVSIKQPVPLARGISPFVLEEIGRGKQALFGEQKQPRRRGDRGRVRPEASMMLSMRFRPGTIMQHAEIRQPIDPAVVIALYTSARSR